MRYRRAWIARHLLLCCANLCANNSLLLLTSPMQSAYIRIRRKNKYKPSRERCSSIVDVFVEMMPRCITEYITNTEHCCVWIMLVFRGFVRVVWSYHLWSMTFPVSARKTYKVWIHTFHIYISQIRITLRWRHNGRDSVSNHQPYDCLLNVYSDADQRKHQSSASLAFVRGIHLDRWIPRTNGQ